MTYRPPKKPALALQTDLVSDNMPAEVYSNIYVGSIHAAFNQEALLDLGITHILNASRLPSTFPKTFTYLAIDVRDKDDANILACIPASNIFIEAGADSGGVLVHCYGGRSRSAALVCAFLMSSLGWSYSHALAVIQLGRPVASINSGFEAQLKAYVHAKYDVYVAQQVLLRGRVCALQSYRAISGSTEDDLATKERERKKFGGAVGLAGGGRGGRGNGGNSSNGNGGNPGNKRTWKNAKEEADDDKDDDDIDEEDDMLCQHIAEDHQQLQPYQHHVTPFKQSSSGATALPPIAVRTASTGSQTGPSQLRQQIPLMDPRSPRLRLSRPGSNAVRVIPPLRGLERVYCCSWCQRNLFNLASVIRTDLDILPLPDLLTLDAGQKCSSRGDNSGRSRGGGPGGQGNAKDSHTFLMPAPSPRANATAPTPRNSFAADAKSCRAMGHGGVAATGGYKDPPMSTRGPCGKAFTFDLDSPTSDDSKGRRNAFEFGPDVMATGQEGKERKCDSPLASHNDRGSQSSDINDYDSDLTISRESGEISASERNRLYLDVSPGGDESGGSTEARSKPPSGSIPNRVRNASTSSSPIESPRIPFPPQREERESFAYPSPRDRPPSAEKRRWLARVNLLRTDQRDGDGCMGSSQSKSELKVAKLSSDDDEAIKLGFGREKYIHIEYLEWMGEELLSQSIDEGEIRCDQCRNVLGMWTWNPSERQSLNGCLQPPVIRIHKNVVHEVDIPLDQTPMNTPRLDDAMEDNT